MLSLEGTFTLDGLQGGDIEFAPHVVSHGTWNGEREMRHHISSEVNQFTTQVGPYKLPDERRGDEAVWVKVYAKTHYSGQADLDSEVYKRRVNLDVPVGIVRVPLDDVIANKPLQYNISDPILRSEMRYMHNWSSNSTQLNDLTTKGKVQFRVVDKPDKWPQLSTSPSDVPLYGSPEGEALKDRALGRFDSLYNSLFGPSGRYKVTEPSVEPLHMKFTENDYGVLPAIAFWQQHTHSRHTVNEEDVKYSVNANYSQRSEFYFGEMLRSSLTRHGFTVDRFVDVVERQHARTDNYVDPLYIEATRAILNTGATVGTGLHYTSDMRYPSKDNKFRSRRGGAYMQRQMTYSDRQSDLANSSQVGLESFDSDGLYGVSNRGDCDDSACAATSTLRDHFAFNTVATSSGKYETQWKTDLMKSAQKVMNQYMIYDVAASTTAAYATSKIDSKPIDLPLVGDSVDRQQPTGGHMHGIMISRGRSLQFLENGGTNLQTELPSLYEWRKTDAQPWNYELPSFVPEGTCQTNGEVLPVCETHKDPISREKAQLTRDWVRSAGRNYPTFTHRFRPESMPHYFDEKEPSRRVSTFYRGATFLISTELFAQNPLYGVLASGKRAEESRGVDIGQLMRDRGSESDSVALRAPFKELGKEWWHGTMRPYMAMVQNQMPVSVLGRQSPEAAQRFRHVVSSVAYDALYTSPRDATKFGVIMEKNMRGVGFAHRKGSLAPHDVVEKDHIRTIRHINDNDNSPVTLIRFYSDGFRHGGDGAVEKQQTNQQLNNDIRKMYESGGVIAHSIQRLRPLNQCDDIFCCTLAVDPTRVKHQ